MKVTTETKKGQYVYCHCTGHRGPCGNTYIREEELVRQFGDLLRRVRIPTELAGKLATVLRESQTDEEQFVRTSMLRLQQQQMLLRSKLDRVYEDRLSDQIPEELWAAKSAELQEALRRVRTEMERHELASQAYETAGLQILRTRANGLLVVRCEKSARTGASGQNGRIDLHVRPQKSLSYLR
jgi:site-specific DNA recombinase